MEARRYRNRGEPDDIRLSSSNVTIPGLVLITLGILFLVTAIVLYAVYGFPTDMANENGQVAGTICLIIGTLLTITGIGVAIHLNVKHQRQKKQLAKQRKTKSRPNGVQSRQQRNHRNNLHTHSTISIVSS